MQIKLLWDSILYKWEWLESKTQVTAPAGQDVEPGDTHTLLVGMQTIHSL